MAYCWNCGKEAEDDQLYCLNCGVPLHDDSPVEPEKERLPLNVGQLIFSIINLCCCCTVLGIASLVLVVFASNEYADVARKNLKIAKILNIVGVCVSFAVFVITFAFILFMSMLTGV